MTGMASTAIIAVGGEACPGPLGYQRLSQAAIRVALPATAITFQSFAAFTAEHVAAIATE